MINIKKSEKPFKVQCQKGSSLSLSVCARSFGSNGREGTAIGVVWDTKDDTLMLWGSHGLRENPNNTVSSFPPLKSLISIKAQVYNF